MRNIFLVLAAAKTTTVSAAAVWAAITVQRLSVRHMASGLWQHPTQHTATQDVQVEMRNVLNTGLAGVGDGAEAVLYACDFANLSDRVHKADLFFGRRRHREMIQRHIRPFGDDQDMDRRLRCDVFKREGVSFS